MSAPKPRGEPWGWPGHDSTLTVGHHDGGLQDLSPFGRGPDVDSHGFSEISPGRRFNVEGKR